MLLDPLQHVVAGLFYGPHIRVELLIQRVPLVTYGLVGNVRAGCVRRKLGAYRLRGAHSRVGDALLRQMFSQRQQVFLVRTVPVQQKHQVGSGAFILGPGIFDNVRIFAHTPHITDVASCGFTPLGAQKVTFQPKAHAVFRAEKSLSAHNNFVCER